MKSYWIGLVVVYLAGATVLEVTEEPNQDVFNLLGYLSDTESERNEKLVSLLEDVESAGLSEYRVAKINCTTHSAFGVCRTRRGNNNIFIWWKGIQIPYRGDFEKGSLIKWCKNISNTHFTIIESVGQLEEMVNSKRFVYVYFNRDERKQEEVDGFQKVSKYFNTFTFGVVFSKEVREELGGKEGNITVYKYPFVEGNKNDMDNRQLSWDGLLSFVLSWCYPEINKVGDQNELSSKRFKSDAKIEFTALMCDDSFLCMQEVIPKFYEMYIANETAEYRFDVRLHLMILRESHLIKTYYNMKGNEYPAMSYVDLENDRLHVYTESIGDSKSNPKQWIKGFLDKAQEKSFKYDYQSEPVPKNNGLGNGKGIEKQIQHFVYDNLEKTLVENPQKWYLVLFSIFGGGCENCDEFYKEFKKIRSFIAPEDIPQDLVLGRYEFLKNIVDEPLVDKIPDLILYRPADENGVREKVRYAEYHSYDNVMKWLNNELNRLALSEEEL